MIYLICPLDDIDHDLSHLSTRWSRSWSICPRCERFASHQSTHRWRQLQFVHEREFLQRATLPCYHPGCFLRLNTIYGACLERVWACGAVHHFPPPSPVLMPPSSPMSTTGANAATGGRPDTEVTACADGRSFGPPDVRGERYHRWRGEERGESKTKKMTTKKLYY